MMELDEGLPEPTQSAATKGDLSGRQSIPTRVAIYVHLANVVWTLFVLLMGAIPYYHYLGPDLSQTALLVTLPFWGMTYLLTALAHSNHRDNVASACAALWTLACASLLGFTCAVVYNITALQFVAISFGQSIAILMYLQLTDSDNIHYNHDKVHGWWAMPCMMGASLAIWLTSIYAFVVEDDWFFAIGLAGSALLLALHNLRTLNKSGGYTMDDAGVTSAIFDYYVGDAVAMIKRLQA